MKYKQGCPVQGCIALRRMLDGEVMFRNSLPARLTADGEFQHCVDGGWENSYVAYGNCYYEAIPVPEYNLTFMEAWEEMKKGRTVERDDQWRFEFFAGSVQSNRHGTHAEVIVCVGIIDAKYRVVEPE